MLWYHCFVYPSPLCFVLNVNVCHKLFVWHYIKSISPETPQQKDKNIPLLIKNNLFFHAQTHMALYETCHR